MTFSSSSLGSEDGGMEGLLVISSTRARNLATMALWRNMKLYRFVSKAALDIILLFFIQVQMVMKFSSSWTSISCSRDSHLTMRLSLNG